MKHQISYAIKAETMVLTDFSPMEFHCVASHDKLKPGDKVMVIYLATVGKGATIGSLDIPLIVKVSKFQGFIDQLIQIVEEDQQPQSVVPPEIPATGVTGPHTETGILPPYTEAGLAVNVGIPPVEGPAPTPA